MRHPVPCRLHWCFGSCPPTWSVIDRSNTWSHFDSGPVSTKCHAHGSGGSRDGQRRCTRAAIASTALVMRFTNTCPSRTSRTHQTRRMAGPFIQRAPIPYIGLGQLGVRWPPLAGHIHTGSAAHSPAVQRPAGLNVGAYASAICEIRVSFQRPGPGGHAQELHRVSRKRPESPIKRWFSFVTGCPATSAQARQACPPAQIRTAHAQRGLCLLRARWLAAQFVCWRLVRGPFGKPDAQGPHLHRQCARISVPGNQQRAKARQSAAPLRLWTGQPLRALDVQQGLRPSNAHHRQARVRLQSRRRGRYGPPPIAPFSWARTLATRRTRVAHHFQAVTQPLCALRPAQNSTSDRWQFLDNAMVSVKNAAGLLRAVIIRCRFQIGRHHHRARNLTSGENGGRVENRPGRSTALRGRAPSLAAHGCALDKA